ncbi:MAG TPA: hypothetical protein DCX14_00190 [Flavobacteriales bacterium]|nr:hypothetical protein [Flavobacteriales bacterium]
MKLQPPEISLIVEQIVKFNHCWKLARRKLGEEHPLAQALRDRKSCLQATLIREFPNEVELRLDLVTSSEEPIYGIQFKKKKDIDATFSRNDAAHLPVRVASELFSENELTKWVQNE